MDETAVDDKESILITIKKLIGIDKELKEFDADIIANINASFVKLKRLGAGPEEGFEIEDETAKWSDYTQDKNLRNIVKGYIHKKVRLVFDPPSSSWIADSLKEMLKEDEFDIQMIVDTGGGIQYVDV